MEFLWQYVPDCVGILRGDADRGREICGLGADVRLLFAVAAVREERKSVLYIVDDEDQAKKTRRMLRHFLSSSEAGFYPAADRLVSESVSVNEAQNVERAHVLDNLLNGRPFVAVFSKDTLNRRLLPPEVRRASTMRFQVGDVIDISELAARLREIGYVREPLSDEPGRFSVRGSIVDVFPPSAAKPLRIDFFDDEIESIRVYDPDNQVSSGDVDEAVIAPGAVFFLPAAVKAKGTESIREDIAKRERGLRETRKKNFREKSERLLTYVEEDAFPDICEQLLPYFFEEAYIEDYLNDDGLVIMEEPALIGSDMEKEDRELSSLLSELYEAGDILPAYAEMFRDRERVFDALNRRRPLLFSYLRLPTGLDCDVVEDIGLRDFSFYRPAEERSEELIELNKNRELIFCAADENGRKKAEGLIELLELKRSRVVSFPLQKSLEVPSRHVCFIAEADLGVSPAREKTKPRRKKKKGGLTTFVDLHVGDYVVHDTHGIGRYMGMERLRVDETERDYLLIRYGGSDKLYIPTDQIDLLQKYIGSEGDAAPRVNRLGGKEWKKAREKVRDSVREMAEELLRLYAARSKEQGFAFSPDSEWQREMEEDFLFEETPDQSDAIAEIKADMEKPRPMDRLLCGDVGYGKTEVALRAAFKAVYDGKQVVILVPTTVLAQQHERTFHERLDRFGVRIGVLSRMKSGKEQKLVKEGLADGRIDIVIGTHKVFNESVVFKDLGLLIIDEEQRFGVGQKEKIKALKKNIDILAMSATPIPRTLHMSLVGVRDISIIETPPRFRRPVKTYVMEYQAMMIREALRREIERGGQVYYVHNRIEDLSSVAAEIKSFVPDARILVGHGRMSERSLENTMMDFMAGNGDILLCTTIVESGIDLSNVNTLIVDEADRYGLSQMYQLRGRVGRGRQQAFAYFFYPRGKLLNTPAQKRLAAIRDYTDLGSGFKIAMRDMEIRGAGNLLGAEQHGHIASVGFDMYCRLIDEEVRRLSGEAAAKPKEEIPIDILSSAYLPEDYVGDDDTKLSVYKEIAEIDNVADLKRCMEETEDRFGSVPDPVYRLFLVIRLKLLVGELGITAVTQTPREFRLVFRRLNAIDGEDISALMRKFGRRFEFSMTGELVMKIRTGRLDNDKALIFTLKVLTFLAQCRKGKNDEAKEREKAEETASQK